MSKEVRFLLTILIIMFGLGTAAVVVGLATKKERVVELGVTFVLLGLAAAMGLLGWKVQWSGLVAIAYALAVLGCALFVGATIWSTDARSKESSNGSEALALFFREEVRHYDRLQAIGGSAMIAGFLCLAGRYSNKRNKRKGLGD
jgi:uncharacterized membrane protein YgdD (TMEM256/DUF423 family)